MIIKDDCLPSSLLLKSFEALSSFHGKNCNFDPHTNIIISGGIEVILLIIMVDRDHRRGVFNFSHCTEGKGVAQRGSGTCCKAPSFLSPSPQVPRLIGCWLLVLLLGQQRHPFSVSGAGDKTSPHCRLVTRTTLLRIKCKLLATQILLPSFLTSAHLSSLCLILSAFCSLL